MSDQEHEISPAEKTPLSSSTSIFSGLETLMPPTVLRPLPPMSKNACINFTTPSTWPNNKPFQFSTPVQSAQDSESKLDETRQGKVNFQRFLANDGPFKYSANAFETLKGLGSTSLIVPVEVFEVTALERDTLFKNSVKLQEGNHALQQESKTPNTNPMSRSDESKEQHNTIVELHRKEVNDIYDFLGWQNDGNPFAPRVIQYLQGQNELVNSLLKRNKELNDKNGQLESQVEELKEQIKNGALVWEQAQAEKIVNLDQDFISKINKSEARIAEIQALHKLEIDEFRYRLEDSTKACTKHSSQLIESEEKIAEIEIGHKQEIAAIKVRLRESRSSHEDLISQKNASQEKINELTSSLDRLITEGRITLSAHEIKVNDLTTKLAEANDEAEAAWNIVDDERKEHEEEISDIHKQYQAQLDRSTSEDGDLKHDSEEASSVETAYPERTIEIRASQNQIEDAISEVNSRHATDIASIKASHERKLENLSLEKELLENKHHDTVVAHGKELADVREILQVKIDILTTKKIELEEYARTTSEMYSYHTTELQETLAPLRNEISFLTEQRDDLQQKLSRYSEYALKMENTRVVEIAEVKASLQQQIDFLTTRNRKLEFEIQTLTTEKQELMDTSSTLISATGDAIEDLRVKEIVLQEESAFKDAQAREITEVTEEHMEATQECIQDLELKAQSMGRELKIKDDVIASLQGLLAEQTTTVETYIAEVDNASKSPESRKTEAESLGAIPSQIIPIKDRTPMQRIDVAVEERISRMVKDIIQGLNSAKMAIPQPPFDDRSLVLDDFSCGTIRRLEGTGDLRNHVAKDFSTGSGTIPALNEGLIDNECLLNYDEKDSTLLADKKLSPIPEPVSMVEHYVSHAIENSDYVSAEEKSPSQESLVFIHSKKAKAHLSCGARIAYTIHTILWLVAIVSLHCYVRLASTDISSSFHSPVPNINTSFTHMPDSFFSIVDLSTKSTEPRLICWRNESATDVVVVQQSMPLLKINSQEEEPRNPRVEVPRSMGTFVRNYGLVTGTMVVVTVVQLNGYRVFRGGVRGLGYHASPRA